MVVKNDDGFDRVQRPGSLQGVREGFSSIHIGVVTATNGTNRTAYVSIPALNDSAELGPYSVMQAFTVPATVSSKQTLSSSSGSASAPDLVSTISVITSVSLGGSTANDVNYSSSLNMPSIGNRVLVVLINESLDEGVIVGKL